MYDIPGIYDRCDCSPVDGAHRPTCAALHPPPPPPPPSGARSHIAGDPPVERCHHGYATAVCGPCYRGEDGPPAEWLAVWASGYLGGYATGYEHGHEDGDREHGERLAEALNPMRRAAAHGIDVALARGAWQQHQRRMGGGS